MWPKIILIISSLITAAVSIVDHDDYFMLWAIFSLLMAVAI